MQLMLVLTEENVGHLQHLRAIPKVPDVTLEG